MALLVGLPGPSLTARAGVGLHYRMCGFFSLFHPLTVLAHRSPETGSSFDAIQPFSYSNGPLLRHCTATLLYLVVVVVVVVVACCLRCAANTEAQDIYTLRLIAVAATALQFVIASLATDRQTDRQTILLLQQRVGSIRTTILAWRQAKSQGAAPALHSGLDHVAFLAYLRRPPRKTSPPSSYFLGAQGENTVVASGLH